MRLMSVVSETDELPEMLLIILLHTSYMSPSYRSARLMLILGMCMKRPSTERADETAEMTYLRQVSGQIHSTTTYRL
jgi:hypothetical protein